uniref:beta-glucosidase n=1 Tax=uncultured bacterium contig00010(2014) TaxID=1465626 RepID=A0A060CVY6_9BACT|nr:hypothetical protein [uncultured bacterium contig00010(2014)]
MVALGAGKKEVHKELYKDPKAPVKERIEDLLSRMTLEEKVGQMNQFVGVEHIKANSAVLTEDDLKNNTAQAFYPGITHETVVGWTREGLVGSFLHVLTIEEANMLQREAMKSRLAIPILFGIDAIHGNANAPDNTVYPTNIGLASSFDRAMAYRIARQTAAEMRAMGMHWTFNPNVDVARDPRWGRVGETFGEDPYLVTELGSESVRGYQGTMSGPNDVLACVKHFVGGSQPVNGTNGSPTDVSERTLREVFFPPYERLVKEGVGSIMMSHNEVGGIPAHENEWLMESVARGEWGFGGFVVSDWMDIEHLWDVHRTAPSLKEAFYQSIVAGMDMHMHGVKWNELVCELVREGRITEERIDQSVRRILEVKFRLGLFESPYADEKKTMTIRLSAEHRATALEAARNGIVLLKNDGLLPLDAAKLHRVMVTGINADDENILGDWSASQRPENVTTILEGLRQVAPGVEFDFVDQGWNPVSMSPEAVERAAATAREVDLNIVVAGEYMMRHRWTQRTGGEDTDRSDIELVGLQNELIERVAASGKPTVLVLVNGRQLGVEWAAEHLPAIIEAWEPGMYGGQAVAEILFGVVNPSAKLPVTIPRSVGQLQMVYNHKPSQYFHPYAAGKPSTPLWAFGHGLSYTTFEYSNLAIDRTEIAPDGTVKVSVTVRNTGSREGTEIVQLYIRDLYSSVTRPVKELKDFARVTLKAGESQQISFTVTANKLAFLDKNLRTVVEPGEFEVMVGPSSEETRLLRKKFSVMPRAGIIATLERMAKEGKVMFGHQDDTAYGHSWNGLGGDIEGSDTRAVCGDYPAVMGWDIGSLELGIAHQLDSIPATLLRRLIIEHAQRGGINTISWHSTNPATGGSAWDTSGGNVVRTILPGGANHAKFRQQLSRVADFLESLKTPDEHPIEIIFRPWHEHTGGWFWWGDGLRTDQEYIQLWRQTADYLRVDRGLTNLIFAYSPNLGADRAKYLATWPGGEWVDLLGFDIYPRSADDLSTPLALLKQLGHELSKPTALTETGVEGVPDPRWWTQTLWPAVKDSGVSYVLVWRNAWNRPEHHYGPYPGHPSEADFKEFYRLPQTVFSKNL